MKTKASFTCILIFWIFANTVFSGSNIMKIHDITAEPGSIITIELEIINEDAFAGFNVDIPLPAGFVYIEGSATLFRDNGHLFNFGIVGENVARAISFAMPTTFFTGNNGVVMSFDVQTPGTIGSWSLEIINAVIADEVGNNIMTGAIPGTVNLQEDQPGFSVDINVILEGPYTPGLANLMSTSLRDNGMIPLSQPYGPSLPYYGNNSPLWYYTGTESVSSLPVDVVDWVLLELRDAPTPAQATDGTVTGRMAAFLHNTGQIRAIDGMLPAFDIPVQHNLYVVVYHRNHLAVMSSGELTETAGVYSWDFTQSAGKAYAVYERSAYQNGHKHLGDGVYGMYGGDGDANGQIQTQDKNEVWNPQSGSSGYLPGDFDMNGQVQTQDKNNIWNPNSGVASQVP